MQKCRFFKVYTIIYIYLFQSLQFCGIEHRQEHNKNRKVYSVYLQFFVPLNYYITILLKQKQLKKTKNRFYFIFKEIQFFSIYLLYIDILCLYTLENFEIMITQIFFSTYIYPQISLYIIYHQFFLFYKLRTQFSDKYLFLSSFFVLFFINL